MITPNDQKGSSTELFQYDGPSPFVRNRPKIIMPQSRTQNHAYNHDENMIPGPTYSDNNSPTMANNFREESTPTRQHSRTTSLQHNDNDYYNNSMRWPSLVSLPATMGEALKKGTHLLSDSWREIKHLSHIDSNSNSNVMGATAPTVSTSLVYDCLMSELRDALKAAEKRKDQREAEERRAKNLPDYSWLMDPTMRERKRYKMPPEESNQINALCWRVPAEECNNVLRRFRESIEKERRQEDEDGETLLPSSIPSLFKSVLNDVIVESEQKQYQQTIQEQKTESEFSQAAAFDGQQQQQQSWGDWLQEKFTGSVLNLSSIAFGSGGGGEAPSTSRAFGGSNRIVPMQTLHTVHDNDEYAAKNAAFEQSATRPQFERGGSVQSDTSNVTLYDAQGTPLFCQQNSLGPLTNAPPRNASAASLASTDNYWAQNVANGGGSIPFHRSISAASTATVEDSQNTPGTHLVNFSQLNPAALMQEHTQQQKSSSLYRTENGDYEGGKKFRRESTVSEDSMDSVSPTPVEDDESRQEVGAGWNWFSDENTRGNVSHTIMRQNERGPISMGKNPFY